MRSAGGSDIDNASKPVVLLCGGGRCWVATPRKVKEDLGFTDSASSVPQLRTRTGQGSQGLDRPGHRSGSRPQNSTLVESSIEHVHTAPQPLRAPCHRAGTVIRGGMLCIIATMYSLYSPMSVEGQYPPSRRLLASAPSGPVSRQRPCGPGPSQKLFEPSPSARVGFVLFWGRPKRGVDPLTRGCARQPIQGFRWFASAIVPQGSFILSRCHLEASYFEYVPDPPANHPILGSIEPLATRCRNTTLLRRCLRASHTPHAEHYFGF